MASAFNQQEGSSRCSSVHHTSRSALTIESEVSSRIPSTAKDTCIPHIFDGKEQDKLRQILLNCGV